MSESIHSDCHPLIVDDDPDFTLLLWRGLGKVGVPGSRIRSCVDGDEAMRFLSEDQYLPSFILLDLQMPRRSGLEVLEWIRRAPSPLAEVLVFMMTSNSDPGHVARAFDLGAASYIIKPSESVALNKVLGEIVRCW